MDIITSVITKMELTHPPGHNYLGHYKHAKWHGQGTYTFPDGSKFVGEWKDGNSWNGNEYDEEGNVTATFSDGVWKEK